MWAILGYENMLWKKRKESFKLDYSASCLSGYTGPGGNSGPSRCTAVDEQGFSRVKSLYPSSPKCAPEPQKTNCRA